MARRASAATSYSGLQTSPQFAEAADAPFSSQHLRRRRPGEPSTPFTRSRRTARQRHDDRRPPPTQKCKTRVVEDDGVSERFDPSLEPLRLGVGVVPALEVVGAGVLVEGAGGEEVPAGFGPWRVAIRADWAG